MNVYHVWLKLHKTFQSYDGMYIRTFIFYIKVYCMYILNICHNNIIVILENIPIFSDKYFKKLNFLKFENFIGTYWKIYILQYYYVLRYTFQMFWSILYSLRYHSGFIHLIFKNQSKVLNSNLMCIIHIYSYCRYYTAM